MTDKATECCPSWGHELEWVERPNKHKYYLCLDEHEYGFCIERYSFHDPELPFYAYCDGKEIGHFEKVEEAKARCQEYADDLAKRMCAITKEGAKDA